MTQAGDSVAEVSGTAEAFEIGHRTVQLMDNDAELSVTTSDSAITFTGKAWPAQETCDLLR
jgi:hypothetical protein